VADEAKGSHRISWVIWALQFARPPKRSGGEFICNLSEGLSVGVLRTLWRDLGFQQYRNVAVLNLDTIIAHIMINKLHFALFLLALFLMVAQGEMVALPPTPILLKPDSAATDLGNSVQLIWSTVLNVTTYHLQVSTGPNFASPANVIDTNIPAPDTSRQLGSLAHHAIYYWRVSAIDAGGESPFSSVFYFTTVATKSISQTIETFASNPTSSTDYRLVSIPGTDGFTLGQLLTGSQGTDWRAFQDNGGVPPNHLTELTAGFSLKDGEGYWMLKRGALSFSQTVTMPALDADGSYSISVRSSWNVIGNPFDLPVNWDVVKAANGGLSGEPIYKYVGQSGTQTETDLNPFKGYYFNNTTGLSSLAIPYPFPGTQAPSSPTPPIEWKLQLEFESDINRDSENHIGVSPVASIDRDELDKQKPPPFLDQGFLYFSRPEWDNRYSIFRTDFRRELAEGQVWPFEVRNPRLSMDKIRVVGIQDVPAGYDIVLINLHNSVPVNVRGRNDYEDEYEYEYQTVSEKMSFKLIVGKKDFIEVEIQKTIPTEFKLEQNYPNPFNPSTSITFRVPREADVQLEIMSVLGQRVAILAEGRYSPGVYTAVWNTNSAGVASGVYFYKLFVDDKAFQTRKMLLLR